MIHKVGLLPRCNLEQLPFAYDMYKRKDKESHDLSRIFKETFSINVKIKFVGVWYVVCLSIDSCFMSPRRDTVNAVGFIERKLPFSDKNITISYFRHAMSLDERRVKFRPSHYTGTSEIGNGGAEIPREDMKESSGDTVADENPRRSSDSEMEGHFMNNEETAFEEVFFAGAHCGVFWSICAPRSTFHSHPFRRRRRIGEKQGTQQSSTYSSSVDDQRILQH